jgi:hypothetical protein
MAQADGRQRKREYKTRENSKTNETFIISFVSFARSAFCFPSHCDRSRTHLLNNDGDALNRTMQVWYSTVRKQAADWRISRLLTRAVL